MTYTMYIFLFDPQDIYEAKCVMSNIISKNELAQYQVSTSANIALDLGKFYVALRPLYKFCEV